MQANQNKPTDRTFYVTAFGAVPDGKTLSTQAIQAAVDACHAAGGGQVYCGPGNFVTGTVVLKSHVELHVTAGCRLQGSRCLDDYRDLKVEGFRHEHSAEQSACSLLQAVQAENVTLSGQGTIDGMGLAFYRNVTTTQGKLEKPPTPRPRIGMFYKCRNLTIRDLSLVDSACWTLWLMHCEDIRIQGIKIDGNRRMRNIDGIDLDSCRNAMVSDCRITTEDDSLVIRAMQKLYDMPCTCENIVVNNCILDSSCQAVRIGCPGDGTIRDCTLSNLVIKGTGNGIVFDNPKRYLGEGRRGTAHVSRLLFENLSIDCARIPIKMTVEEGITLPRLGDVTFANGHLRGGAPCLIAGNSTTTIENVRLQNLGIESASDQALVARHCRGMQMDAVTLAHFPQDSEKTA